MILFDLDGTILNSAEAILRAYRASIIEACGYDIEPDAEHVHELLRRRPIEYFEQHYPPNARKMAEGYAKAYTSDLVRPYEGMVELVSELAAKTSVGIVSNKGRARIVSDLRKVGLNPELLSIILGAEDTVRRKPHPDPILKAIEILGRPDSPLHYVGDGPHDVEAAHGANAIAVAVTWGYYPEAALKAAGPGHVVSHVADLRTLLRGAAS